MNPFAIISHTVVAVALIAAYAFTGERELLVGLFAYLGGAGAQGASTRA